MENETVDAGVSLWDIKPGQWLVRQGLDENNDGQMDDGASERTLHLERGSELELGFAPGKYTLLRLALQEPARTDYSTRPDLAICASGITIEKNRVKVRVYSQGSTGSPETLLVLKDARGKRISTSLVPPLDPPLDLVPKWVDVVLEVPEGTDLKDATVEVDPDHKITQITRLNTLVRLTYPWQQSHGL
jgi:hypothetical protein